MSNNRITDDISGIEGKTIIGPATRLKGDVEGKNDFHLEGELEGTLKLENLFFIGRKGHFQGEAEAVNVIIEGQVDGNLKIKKKVEIRGTGRVTGNIVCHQIAIAEGSYFQGGIKMGDGAAASPTYFTEKRQDLLEKGK